MYARRPLKSSDLTTTMKLLPRTEVEKIPGTEVGKHLVVPLDKEEGEHLDKEGEKPLEVPPDKDVLYRFNREHQKRPEHKMYLLLAI